MIDKTYKRYGWIAFSSLMLTLLVTSACTPAVQPPGQTPALEGTEWKLVRINDREPLAGTEPTLLFEVTSLGGTTGCNHFGGDYTYKSDGTLTIRDLMQTEMYCIEPEGVMEQEVEYMGKLIQAASYRVVDERLEILDQAGVSILIYEQR